MLIDLENSPCVDFEEKGFEIVSDVLPPSELIVLGANLKTCETSNPGTRNLLELPWCAALAGEIKMNPAIRRLLGEATNAIQCTLFDKTAETNWLVAIHQDLNVPVNARNNHPSLKVWSEKEGQLFIQAPAELLAQLVAVRIHIDDCHLQNGALRVVPGSHKFGRLAGDRINALRGAVGEVVCEVRAGGALLLRPLLLHASSKAAVPDQRRVLHFLFAPKNPGYGLKWRYYI